MSNLRTPEVEDLLEVLSSMSDKDQLYALCEDLFTIREMKETSQRLSVARLLDAGKPYTAIAEATGASATTIARVSKPLSGTCPANVFPPTMRPLRLLPHRHT